MSDCVEWSGCRNQDGYGMKWWKGGPKGVHRIVFDLYNGYLPPVVRHTCDNPACYNVEHLVSGTQRDNTRDSIERGRFRRHDGENNNRAILSESNVHAIRRMFSTGLSVAEIAGRYGVSPNTIYDIKRGTKWKNV